MNSIIGLVMGLCLLIQNPPNIDYSQQAVQYENMPVYSTSSVKRYEDYRCITNVESQAYKLTRAADICTDGTLEIEGYKLVALGKSYGEAGDRLIVTLNSDGYIHELEIMIADHKQNCHTLNSEGYVGCDGHVIEAIVYDLNLPSMVKRMGDLNYIPSWSGDVVEIRKIYNAYYGKNKPFLFNKKEN